MKKLFLIYILFLTFFISCKPDRIYEKHKKLSSEMIWLKKEKQEFKVEIKDQKIKYNQSVTMRYITGFPYKDLYIQVTTIAPSGQKSSKPYSLQVFDENKKYKGDGLGDYWDYEQPIEKNILFNETGSYTFIVEHVMPFDTIPFVMEIGMAIDKIKK